METQGDSKKNKKRHVLTPTVKVPLKTDRPTSNAIIVCHFSIAALTGERPSARRKELSKMAARRHKRLTRWGWFMIRTWRGPRALGRNGSSVSQLYDPLPLLSCTVLGQWFRHSARTRTKVCCLFWYGADERQSVGLWVFGFWQKLLPQMESIFARGLRSKE